MKKVLLCIPSLGTGGAERFVVDLALRIDKNEYEVIVVETRQHVESMFRNTLDDAGIRVENLAAKSYIKMLKKQLAFFKKENPDIVHANIGSVLHLMVACKLMNIPTRIYTVHNEAKLLFGNNNLKKIIYKLAFLFFKFTPVAICPTVKKTLVDDLKINPKQIPIVNNGVDIERYSPAQSINTNNEIKIISVGTLYWIKNQELAIRAVCNLHNKFSNISFDIIGDGPDRKKLEELIEENDAKNYITLCGRKKNVEDYLRQADIYISTSKTEGLPLSILEAMACGLPILATNVGGVVDIVHNNVNGYIVQSDSLSQVENALEILIASQLKRDKFGKESRLISEEWSLNKCVKGYEKLYENGH